VNRQKFFCGPQVEKPLSKRLKPSGAAYRRLKVNGKEKLTKYTRFIYAYVKKAEEIGRVMMRKVTTTRQITLITPMNKRPFSVCECFIIPYIFNRHETSLLSFEILVSKFQG